MIRTTSSSIMPTVVNNGGKEIPTGLLVTLSITFVSPAPFLCPYISVSLFHALSRYLCVSLGVSVSLMPPFVYSTSNSLLKATHTHTHACTYHLRFGGTNFHTSAPFLSASLNMALKWEFSRVSWIKESGFYTFQIYVAKTFHDYLQTSPRSLPSVCPAGK